MFRLFGLLLVGLVLGGCQTITNQLAIKKLDDLDVCNKATEGNGYEIIWQIESSPYVIEAKNRKLDCLRKDYGPTKLFQVQVMKQLNH